MTKVELVGELERLAHNVWIGDEPEGACIVGASDFCSLIGEVGIAIVDARRKAEIRYRAALEAFWADEARHFAESTPQGEGAVRTVDENMAIAFAAVRVSAKRGEFLRLLDFFAMEFVKLALAFFEPRPDGGEVVFECRDFLAAKKSAEAMKRLAGAIDELSRSDCYVKDVHDAIIAYCHETKTSGLKTGGQGNER